MPNPLNTPITITINQSLQKWLIILMPHIIAFGFVLLIAAFPLWLKVVLGVLISLSALYYARLHLLQVLKKSVKSIHQDSAKNWFITTHDGSHESEQKNVVLLPSSFINNALIVLNYRTVHGGKKGDHYSAIITPDSISGNKFRRLGIRLKLINIKDS